MKQHTRIINSHPLHRDITIRLYLRNGTTEILVLKSNIYHHFKVAWRASLTSKKHDHVVLQIHSEDGKLFHNTLKQMRELYKPVIQVL